MNRRLYRSQSESILGGVAGGVAELIDYDPAVVRATWALLALITGGAFLILYIVMWVVVPVAPDGGEAQRLTPQQVRVAPPRAGIRSRIAPAAAQGAGRGSSGWS